ncbi:Bug family tripartite tricarboxylate transporter substrate binding protein [Variovorax terrae]|uniref:Tripartite tricarboxylate transporter substrate binding protein n=1 Tax=Variovorax terrae TaxID=2923278 RepID=A0A9X2APK0_9BURK|nr:tripartite tricarboxylate transporter substrate binding protein [Variovorax terrae]MCJ0763597.1 tripartite tricarboxylate transporter substrate binding protein [Variovorax terrae]
MMIFRAIAAMACTAAACVAFAQDYPQQPIKVVLPFTAGGGTDSVTRIITEPLGKLLGQSVVIDYKAGGNTIIGAQAVATARPDGYTFLATMDMTATILPAVYSKLPFDPAKDLMPVALLAQVPALFVAHPSVPARNLKELVEYSKRHPGKLNYGSAVLYGQVLGQQLKGVSGLSYTYVPYKGAPEAVQALLGGHLDFMMLDIATGLNFLKDGRLKALAITAPQRSPQLPDVPTVGEMGWPEVEMSVWYGLFAPTGTPASVVEKVNAGVAQVVADPAIRKRLADLGHEVSPLSPVQVQALLRKDTAKWTKAAREGNIRLD